MTFDVFRTNAFECDSTRLLLFQLCVYGLLWQDGLHAYGQSIDVPVEARSMEISLRLQEAGYTSARYFAYPVDGPDDLRSRMCVGAAWLPAGSALNAAFWVREYSSNSSDIVPLMVSRDGTSADLLAGSTPDPNWRVKRVELNGRSDDAQIKKRLTLIANRLDNFATSGLRPEQITSLELIADADLALESTKWIFVAWIKKNEEGSAYYWKMGIGNKTPLQIVSNRSEAEKLTTGELLDLLENHGLANEPTKCIIGPRATVFEDQRSGSISMRLRGNWEKYSELLQQRYQTLSVRPGCTVYFLPKHVLENVRAQIVRAENQLKPAVFDVPQALSSVLANGPTPGSFDAFQLLFTPAIAP